MIEIRTKLPGGIHWIVRDFDQFMTENEGITIYIVRNQKEKDAIDGYALVYGREITVLVGKHLLGLGLKDPYLFLWVVEIEELS